MGKSKHFDRVRGVPGKLPRIFYSRSTMPSSESRVTGLLDEISELKGLLIVQQHDYKHMQHNMNHSINSSKHR
jgi:hypothetical protein